MRILNIVLASSSFLTNWAMENDPTQDAARRIKEEVERLHIFDSPEKTYVNVPKKVVGALHKMVDTTFKENYGWCLKDNGNITYDLTFLRPDGLPHVVWRGDATKGWNCASCQNTFCPFSMEKSEHGDNKCPLCFSLKLGLPVNIKSKNKIDDFIYNKDEYFFGSPLEKYGSFEIQVILPKTIPGVCKRKQPMLLTEETNANFVVFINKNNKERKLPVKNGDYVRVKNTRIIELTDEIKVTWYQLMDDTWIHNLIPNKDTNATPQTAEFKIQTKEFYDQDLYGILVSGHFQYPDSEAKGSFIYAIDVYTGMNILPNPQGYGYVGTVYSTYATEKFDLLNERYHNDPLAEQSDAYARDMNIGPDDILIVPKEILNRHPNVKDVQKYVDANQYQFLNRERKVFLGFSQRYIKFVLNKDSYKIFGEGAEGIMIFVKKDKFNSIRRQQQNEAVNQDHENHHIHDMLTEFFSKLRLGYGII